MPKQQTKSPAKRCVLFARLEPEMYSRITEYAKALDVTISLAAVTIIEAGLQTLDEDQQAEEG